MKLLVIASVLATAGLAGNAFAACTGTALTGSQITAALSGKTVCVGTSGNWQAQEYHNSNGTITEYARGPGDLVDGSKDIGGWSVANNQITYSYTGGSPYTFTVYQSGSNFSFCNGATEAASATVKATSSGCQ